MRWEDDTDTLKINVQVNFKWTTRATRMVKRRVCDRRIESSWSAAASSSSSSTKNKKLRIEKRKKETRAEEKNVPTVSKSSIVHFHYYCTLCAIFSQIINFVLFFLFLSHSLAPTPPPYPHHRRVVWTLSACRRSYHHECYICYAQGERAPFFLSDRRWLFLLIHSSFQYVFSCSLHTYFAIEPFMPLSHLLTACRALLHTSSLAMFVPNSF